MNPTVGGGYGSQHASIFLVHRRTICTYMQANVTRSLRSDCYPTFLRMYFQQSSLFNALSPVILRVTYHRYFSLASQGLIVSCHIANLAK